METLKKYFPLSFKRTDTVGNLIVGILIYLVVGIVAGALVALSSLIAGWIAIIGWLLGIVGSLVDLYILAGIVIQILVFLNVIKD